MNLIVPGAQRDDFLEEGNELTAGVASGRFAVDPPGGRVQGGIQGQCSMAVVLESAAFSTTGRKRQHGIQVVQRPNGGLLIHAEHCCVPRRIQIQADDIGS